MSMARVYLDYNATAPLRAEARAAMLGAMDLIGNPSSVHAEGRAVKMLVERSRTQVAAAVGCKPQEVVFTSGATEAAALGAAQHELVRASQVEHDAVHAWVDALIPVGTDGQVALDAESADRDLVAIQTANSETGIVQALPAVDSCPNLMIDFTQTLGKVPFAFGWTGAVYGVCSAHKIGGPKGVGALIVKEGTDLQAAIKGGGQEMGRRSGTENIVGIAGFGAAAEAAQRDLENGIWDGVKKLRKILEKAIEESASQTIFVGKGMERLPNTSCFITPGWKGETQVMAMDLAGFAISAGSACSSGKVKASRVLSAMGFDDSQAASAVRVSLGPQTSQDEVLGFAEAWGQQHKKFHARVA